MVLVNLLDHKLKALEDYNIQKIDAVMKEEQVHVLASRGFEKNLAKFRTELSLEGETLSEVISNLPEEEQERFTELFERFQIVIESAKELNETCQKILKTRMDEIGKVLKKVDGDTSTYNPGEEHGEKRAPKPMSQSI